ncbi:hypothetical protein KI387_020218, partial [Taxus chinensis]
MQKRNGGEEGITKKKACGRSLLGRKTIRGKQRLVREEGDNEGRLAKDQEGRPIFRMRSGCGEKTPTEASRVLDKNLHLRGKMSTKIGRTHERKERSSAR